MKLTVACPSYKRSDRLETPKALPDIKVVIGVEEEAEYRERNPGIDFLVAPKGVQGNLCRIRNWMIEQLLPSCDCLLLLDDDFQGLHKWTEGVEHLLTLAQFGEFLQKYAYMAFELGVYLWGVNVNTDRQCYREQTPFSMVAYIGGPFQAVMAGCEPRYDEALNLKEDYDFSLQHLNRYRKVLRVNSAYYKVRQVEQVGGCSTQRSITEETRQLKALQVKWGSKIVKTSNRDHIAKTRKRDKKIQINPIIHPPIKGV